MKLLLEKEWVDMIRIKYMEIYESLCDKIDIGIYYEMMFFENILVKEYGVLCNIICCVLKELMN